MENARIIMLSDAETDVCVDGVCAVPAPQPEPADED
jgi:hypothetical protein